MNVIRKIFVFFVVLLPLTIAQPITAYSYSFDIDDFLDDETSFVMKKILVFISSLIKDKNEDIISRPDQKYEIEGWCTIRPQDNFDMVFDYGSDSIGAAVTFELYDNKDEVGVMNIYDTGMKDYDSQSIFIKPVSDDMPGVYRLITPNGWKISENVTTGEIVLEEDTGAGNQMWRVEPDDNGLFFFYNKTSGNLLDFSDKDKPTASPEQEPFGQQFALFYRNYTGWNWISAEAAILCPGKPCPTG